MKKSIIGTCLILGLLTGKAFGQKNVAPVVNPPKDAAIYIAIDDDDHDFGNILFKKPVDYAVHIQNISKDTLVLTNVQVSCGCTLPEWKRGPYAPRDTFSIKINFNGYADGKFMRTLTLQFNDKSSSPIVKVLRFRGVGYEKLPVAADNSKDGIDDDNVDATAMTKSERNEMFRKNIKNYKYRVR